MRWQVSKVVTLRPEDSSLVKVLNIVVFGPLLLLLAAVLLVPLALIGLYYILWGRWQPDAPAAPAPAPAPPVCVLDTPTLRIELLDDDAGWPPELEQLHENWDAGGESDALQLVTTTPALPGLHGRLATAFCYPWHGGLLVQVVEAGADEGTFTSWLGWADPVTQTWQPLVEVGPFVLYRSADAPANVIEGWNQGVGKIRLELQAAVAGS